MRSGADRQFAAGLLREGPCATSSRYRIVDGVERASPTDSDLADGPDPEWPGAKAMRCPQAIGTRSSAAGRGAGGQRSRRSRSPGPSYGAAAATRKVGTWLHRLVDSAGRVFRTLPAAVDLRRWSPTSAAIAAATSRHGVGRRDGSRWCQALPAGPPRCRPRSTGNQHKPNGSPCGELSAQLLSDGRDGRFVRRRSTSTRRADRSTLRRWLSTSAAVRSHAGWLRLGYSSGKYPGGPALRGQPGTWRRTTAGLGAPWPSRSKIFRADSGITGWIQQCRDADYLAGDVVVEPGLIGFGLALAQRPRLLRQYLFASRHQPDPPQRQSAYLCARSDRRTRSNKPSGESQAARRRRQRTHPGFGHLPSRFLYHRQRRWAKDCHSLARIGMLIQ